MIALLQRVTSGKVSVNNIITGRIGSGLVIFLGVFDYDDQSDADYLTEKISVFRIFNDKNEKMNLSLLDTGGSALVVSQFTLCADWKKGRRPSFKHAAEPEKGESLYNYFIKELKSKGVSVESGQFGAMMEVSLVNDGPVTFVLDSRRGREVRIQKSEGNVTGDA